MKKALPTTTTQLQDKVKVNIPDKVMNKIHYLCTAISTLEWSGVLFYTVKGSIKNPSKMIITIEDILPMDKGTAASTEFTYDERYVQFLMNKEERLDYKSGLIHSHNNMAVFYSGTDQEELKTNSRAHNFYLSLVVNNKLDIIGRIGILALAESPVKATYKGLDEKGKEYNIEDTTFNVKKEKLFYLDCNMVYKRPEAAIENEFLDNVSNILKPKTVIFKQSTPTAYPNLDSIKDPYGNWDNFKFDRDRQFPKNNNAGILPSFSRPVLPQEKDNSFENFLKKEVEVFLSKCFGFYNEEEEEDEDMILLEDIYETLQEDLDNKETTIPEIIEDFAFGFTSSYDEHFDNTIFGVEIILSAIEEALDENSSEFKFLKEIKNIIRKI